MGVGVRVIFKVKTKASSATEMLQTYPPIFNIANN
jgi:hypothetical protein